MLDSTVADLWFLGEPLGPDGSEIDARRFTESEPFGPVAQPLVLPIAQAGRAARLTFAAFDMPVVDKALAESFALAAGDDIELVPAVAEDGTELMIANVLQRVDCLDESRTVGDKWTERDGRPDKVGEYRTIVRLFIDPSRADHEIFRVSGWEVALVVSDWFADVTGLTAIEGVRLQPVT
jgi:hypothetical protein